MGTGGNWFETDG